MFKRVNFGIKGAWLLENSDNPMYCILTTQYTNFIYPKPIEECGFL